MEKSVSTEAYTQFRKLLIDARKRAGMTQQQVADALGEPQSFVAKYEGAERRLDVVEFVTIARALGVDPVKILRKVMKFATE